MVEVEEAQVRVDKFTTSSLADRMTQEWIRSVRWKAILTLLRYEELGWGVGSLPMCRTSHNTLSQLFQALILNLQDALSWCHSAEFIGTRPILLDEIEQLTTSLAKHSRLLTSFVTRGTTPTRLREKERGGLP
jgi:hypothetical protein